MTDTPTHFRHYGEMTLAAVDIHLAKLRERRAMMRVRVAQATKARSQLSDEKMRDKLNHAILKLRAHIGKMQKADDQAVALITALRILCMQAGSTMVESIPALEPEDDEDEEA